MFLIGYSLGCSVLGARLLLAWINDETTPFTNVAAWVTVVLACLLWPLTAPCVLQKEWLRWQQQTHSKQSCGMQKEIYLQRL